MAKARAPRRPRGARWLFASGGGGWCGGYERLCDYGSARFAPRSGVIGKSGRQLVKSYSTAVDENVIPLGSYVWLDAFGRWFRADDTGGAIQGMHIDVYTAEEDVAVPESSEARVTSEPHGPEAVDPSRTSGDRDRSEAAPPPAAPKTGSFAALDVRAPLGAGELITQCSDIGGDEGSEEVWQTTSSGKDGGSRWATAMYPQLQSGECGSPDQSVHPLVLRTEPAGALDGTWITQCRRVSPGLARVFRVEAETVDGHPAASYVYTQEDASCAN